MAEKKKPVKRDWKGTCQKLEKRVDFLKREVRRLKVERDAARAGRDHYADEMAIKERALIESQEDLKIAEATIDAIVNVASDGMAGTGLQILELRAAIRAMKETFHGALHALDAQINGGDTPSGDFVHGGLDQRLMDLTKYLQTLQNGGYKEVIGEQLRRGESREPKGLEALIRKHGGVIYHDGSDSESRKRDHSMDLAGRNMEGPKD